LREAVLGLLLGLGTGALSVWSLWLITGFTAQAVSGLHVDPPEERVTGWDAEWDEIPDEEKGWGRLFWKKDNESASTLREEPSLQATPESGGSAELRAATFRLVFAFLLKAPILYAIARVAQSMGDVALHWCVGGVVLVYFLAVFYAARRTNRR
jgi:hypothetical protein